MRFTVAFVSALFVAVGLAAPVAEANAGTGEVVERSIKCKRGWVVDDNCVKACSMASGNPAYCVPACMVEDNSC
ncbi:hypothetical protein TARUN_4099 [Trichoderma arundinaceum]|uniref:Uncharacterized protein n=1 Tax=Trichoderma arundinaceum TaxID=490622 RepID=A0A395NQC2_TRIAR|nr:hypothetical protein TARUN_4099 [Trichoderma arundinaceum]